MCLYFPSADKRSLLTPKTPELCLADTNHSKNCLFKHKCVVLWYANFANYGSYGGRSWYFAEEISAVDDMGLNNKIKKYAY